LDRGQAKNLNPDLTLKETPHLLYSGRVYYRHTTGSGTAARFKNRFQGAHDEYDLYIKKTFSTREKEKLYI
jgi:hypothetical protein